jgi:hypothetical protein
MQRLFERNPALLWPAVAPSGRLPASVKAFCAAVAGVIVAALVGAAMARSFFGGLF